MDGKRAAILLNPAAQFPLAIQLRRTGITLGDAFTFLSGLYFRGKLTYATHFARHHAGAVRIITSGQGLMDPQSLVTVATLRAFAAIPIDITEKKYLRPLQRDARKLKATLGPDCEAILLGSIATDKYAAPLLEIFHEKLLFPADFIGRGDMSRGALLLRRARADQTELPYVPVQVSIRRGKRAPRASSEDRPQIDEPL